MGKERVYPSLSQAGDGWVNPVVENSTFPTEKSDHSSQQLDDAHSQYQMCTVFGFSLIFVYDVYEEYYINEHKYVCVYMYMFIMQG